jgi:hypothetical protein
MHPDRESPGIIDLYCRIHQMLAGYSRQPWALGWFLKVLCALEVR